MIGKRIPIIVRSLATNSPERAYLQSQQTVLSNRVQDTAAEALPAVAETAVGAPGTEVGAAGVTADEAVEAAPVPTAFVAATVKV